ncbi:MAG: molybdopterin molybdotransferase MoeA [Geodermatophilaceae bacterium]|nr:molybdopterin molybdotransferase MoeA [Geodermatophilaceae bacterium]MDQ3477153.1 molybdopterin molybdotransferase MoeA [Actinomycetota bacterium]
MRTVEEHRATIAALLPLMPVETIPLARARGLVLAQDVASVTALPPFHNSAMDGYAVRAADVAAVPTTLSVADDIPAGRTSVSPLEPGTAQRIMTGALLPPGADAIVPVEHTNARTDRVTIDTAPTAGAHIRSIGEDIAAGQVALAAGRVLYPAQLGLAAAIGHAGLPVYRRPRVVVLSTGSELIEPGQSLQPGQIYESNSVQLCAAIEDAGGSARAVHFVPDDVEEFLATVESETADADLLVTSGGVSAGAYEVVKDAFSDLGTVSFAKVAMQPGGPQGWGRVGDVPVVTLPGNPVSAFVSFEVFLRPALRTAMRLPAVDRPRIEARLVADVTSPAGKRQFLRGFFADGNVSQVGGPGSHLLAHLARANCLVVIPEDTEQMAVGDTVEVWLLEGI